MFLQIKMACDRLREGSQAKVQSTSQRNLSLCERDSCKSELFNETKLKAERWYLCH
jgi:hypothetical protein